MFAGTADTDGNGGSPLYDAMARANALVTFNVTNNPDAVYVGEAAMEDYDLGHRLRLARPLVYERLDHLLLGLVGLGRPSWACSSRASRAAARSAP